ncbi:MAG: type I-A CRISPR-associated protein Cas4/Csa1 [Acetobacteraceae bacterium]|nr:type I-A CRISPR-associated protein Cas4/Csa1 [Acetobacteraceae bacterium]
MYFLTDEERKKVLRGLLPHSREAGVAEELRGWNWFQPPLEAPLPVRLALYEVAGRYCPTGRDLYMRRVLGIKVRPNKAMIMGSYLHQTMVDVLVQAKRLIYLKGVQNFRQVLQELSQFVPSEPEVRDLQLSPEDLQELKHKAGLVAAFEQARLCSRIQEVLAKQPHVAEDSLAALAVPVVVEQKLDGSFLGLSPNLSADALVFSEPMIMDLKTGERRDFHRLSLAGYALVMEAMYEYPVNLGCTVYVQFRGDRLLVEKEFHILNDELRQWFVEERDEKMRMIHQELDPGRPERCPETCPLAKACRG